MTKTLVVLLGPTGVGKTELSLSLAERIGCPILNADSRQIYRNLVIGSAAPTPTQMARVPHEFVGILDIDAYYSAARFEQDVMKRLNVLFKSHDMVLLSGGSMMYIDAVCKGIDDIPTIEDEVRLLLKKRYENEGLEPLLAELKLLDPEYYQVVDRKNYKRVVHALEVCYQTGVPFSNFRRKEIKKRPFNIIKIGLNRPREELFERINQRVEQMLADGLLEEARSLLPYRTLNALNTVGYKEMFEVLDGAWTLEFAKERMKKNTRVYAKKQLTWFAHDEDILWFSPDETEKIWQVISNSKNHD